MLEDQWVHQEACSAARLQSNWVHLLQLFEVHREALEEFLLAPSVGAIQTAGLSEAAQILEARG